MTNLGLESFEQFMGRALHDPVEGYYRTGIQTVGRGGDFSTSATIFPELGRALARWLQVQRQELAWASPVHLIEVGGGTGDLMKRVLQNLGWWGRRSFQFHSVESSPVLRAQQELNLKGFKVLWHDDMSQAMTSCEGRALIYSNELVDAFPCQVVSYQQGIWKELFLKTSTTGMEEAWWEVSETKALELRQLCPQPVEGQRLEIPTAYRDWLRSWVEQWQGGSMLTIDYGGRSEELFRQHRYGTLRAYFKQMRLVGDEVYRRVGRQDLTFDVNFSLVMQWGAEQGLRQMHYETQKEFIKRMGLKCDDVSASSQAQEMFQVLEQVRGF
ncbi:MAG: SAM-dependent methyltransferase [Blastochloris sp.]|nr:SAM-dependent methyltransferase [Blastochloris sp.]